MLCVLRLLRNFVSQTLYRSFALSPTGGLPCTTPQYWTTQLAKHAHVPGHLSAKVVTEKQVTEGKLTVNIHRLTHVRMKNGCKTQVCV